MHSAAILAALALVDDDDEQAEVASRRRDRPAQEHVSSTLVRAEPFTATTTFAWRWTALHTARTVTTEEDLLAEVLGRDHATRSHTRRPYLRLDIGLRATLPGGAPLALPSPAVWAVTAQFRLTASSTTILACSGSTKSRPR